MYIYIERETDRLTDRQTDRQTDREGLKTGTQLYNYGTEKKETTQLKISHINVSPLMWLHQIVYRRKCF